MIWNAVELAAVLVECLITSRLIILFLDTVLNIVKFGKASRYLSHCLSLIGFLQIACTMTCCLLLHYFAVACYFPFFS